VIVSRCRGRHHERKVSSFIRFIYTFSRCLGKRAHWGRREFKKKEGGLRGTEIEEHATRWEWTVDGDIFEVEVE
jgi:hypothetical protein